MSTKWCRSREWDDRVFPPALWPAKALLRALSSIWLSILTLALVALYLAAGSAPIVPLRVGGELHWVHAWEFVEWTTDQYYSAWPLTALLALFVVNMIVATVRRIEFRLINAGVLTVHTGIVLLASGAAIDAATRERGELFLAAGTPPEWADRFTVAGEIELFVEVGGERATLPLRDLPRYRGRSNNGLSPIVRWSPPFPDAPELSVVAYAPRARMRDSWGAAEGRGVAAWRLEWHGDNGLAWGRVVPAATGTKSTVRLPDSTRLEHMTLADNKGWAVAMAPAPGDADAFLAITSDEGCRLVPVWPGARLFDEASGAEVTVVSIERDSVVPSAIGHSEAAPVSPALIALIRTGEQPGRTVVLLADAPCLSYEIIDALVDPPSVVALSADPLLSKFSFVDAAAPSVTLRGLEAVVRAPGGAVTGPMPIEPGGRLKLGESSELLFAEFDESFGPYRELEVLPRAALPVAEVGMRLHAAVRVGAGPEGPFDWLPVSRWGTETQRLPLPDGRAAAVGVSLASRSVPALQLALERIDQSSDGGVIARVLHRRSEADPPTSDGVSLNRPLRWTASREPATRLSRLFDTLAPVHWQAAIAGWDEEASVRAEGGRFVLLSINSSAGVELIAVGGGMIVLGSPVALLFKPWLLRRRAAGGVA